jgi:hypothetical protein
MFHAFQSFELASKETILYAYFTVADGTVGAEIIIEPVTYSAL